MCEPIVLAERIDSGNPDEAGPAAPAKRQAERAKALVPGAVHLAGDKSIGFARRHANKRGGRGTATVTYKAWDGSLGITGSKTKPLVSAFSLLTETAFEAVGNSPPGL